MHINFLGAVETVTGSCHLIQFNDKKILLDCGQYQGSASEEHLNFDEFEFNPSEIDYLFLSHCHVDHCGRIPLLIKRGFKGQVICTKPTYDLCNIMLLDSAHIQESEAEYKNRKAKRAGKKFVEPLYTQQDAIDSMKYFKPCLYGQMIDLSEDLVIRFSDAGHILGSSIMEIWIKENPQQEPIKLVFTGDLGTADKPILNDPTFIDKADYLIMESTYGDRRHERTGNKMDALVDIILKTAKRGGNVVIPSFAVGRTQEIIYELNKIYDNGTEKAEILKKVPVYIDSPLATKSTDIFKLNSQVFDKESREYVLAGNNPFIFKNLHYIQTSDESIALNFDPTPKIIISASGMCEAGRIKHHLKHNLWREDSSIVFVGYQAQNTLGRKLKDGEKVVKLFNEEITVKAEIYDIEGFSGHADKNDLLTWVSKIKKKPKEIFLVHGEEKAKECLQDSIETKLGIKCIIPKKSVDYVLQQGEQFATEEEFASQAPVENTIAKAEQEVDNKRIALLQNKISRLQCLFDDAMMLTDSHLNQSINVEQYNRINNQLIELENNIMNITILSGK